MGYITKFKLKIRGEDSKVKVEDNCPTCGQHVVKMESRLEELRKYEIDGISLGYLIDSGAESKWYNYDEDMRQTSKEFPEFIFILKGEGESSGDIWTTYYKNGKAQVAKAQIFVDSFDPEKLV